MYELNEQELEQVAGGFTHTYFKGTTASADGGASALLGGAASSSETKSVNYDCYSKSYASNSSIALGLEASAGSGAASSAGVSTSTKGSY